MIYLLRFNAILHAHMGFLVLFMMLVLSAFMMGCSDASSEAETPSVGQTVYQSTCIACHSNGINGAPIYGNKKMWASRLPKGEAALVKSAVEGFSLMPAKGGATELSDEDVAAAVAYMIAAVNQ